ncbi:SNF2-related protein [Spartinivicinus marinus]|uniref:SNF2-related protein n=1 Tax=Spartinivicinus marinus TaxID=2994442 RepID=UPI002254ACE9|nr:SNF2-related protein [Spartinivicinus marinus]MCX4030383.1 SNF2-related protein [Spartinivicinus marinus]
MQNTSDTSFQAIHAAHSLSDLINAFWGYLKPADPIEPEPTPDDSTTEATDTLFGLQKGGKVYREKINAQTREILERVKGDPEALTATDRAILRQYSGRGGLKNEASLFEYYTPTPVAEGIWDALSVNGFANGNVLEPSTGAGVFSATKPEGVIISGAEIDETAAQVNQLLHPTDSIKNQSFEELCANTPDNSFDSVVGNVPFGEGRQFALHDPAYRQTKSIEQYFVLRAIDKAKPGALIALIVPPRIVDNTRLHAFRAKVSKKAEFLGAHKLPSKTFSQQGTDTVTDLIVLKKHPADLAEKIDALSKEVLEEANVLWTPFIKGQYFKDEGKRFIHKRPDSTTKAAQQSLNNTAIKRALAHKFTSRIDWDLLEITEATVPLYQDGDTRVINGLMHTLKDSEWIADVKGQPNVIDKATYGVGSIEELTALLESPTGLLQLSFEQVESAFTTWPALFKPHQRDVITHARQQPDALREQVLRGGLLGCQVIRLKSQLQQGEAADDLGGLQALIKAEFERYGPPSRSKKLIIKDSTAKAWGAFSNATDKDGELSPLLQGQVTEQAQGYDPTHALSIVEYLLNVEKQPYVELADIQRLYNGSPPIENLGDITRFDALAITPDGHILPTNDYYSGDVVDKSQQLLSVMADEKDQRLIDKWQAQIDEMQRRRSHTALKDVQFSLRHKTLDRHYLLDFLKEQQGFQFSYKVEKSVATRLPNGSIEVSQTRVVDTKDPSGQFSAIARWGEKPKGFELQLLNYLNGKPTRVKEEDQAYFRERMKRLESQFNLYLQTHVNAEQIEQDYNDQVNRYITPELSGENLNLSDTSGAVNLHDYQNKAIRQLSEQGAGFLCFGTGLGKTFSGLGLAQYNLDMGRAKRTLIVTPDSVLENWGRNAQQFFTKGKPFLLVGYHTKKDNDDLVVTEVVVDDQGNPKLDNNGKPIKREVMVKDDPQAIFKKCWEIPHGKYSLIIMSHQVYERLPLKPETKLRYQEKWFNNNLISNTELNKATESYKKEKEKARIQGEYGDEGTTKKDQLPYFEDLGVDSVIVDEAHRFKNSHKLGSKGNNLAYLSKVSPSQRAKDMSLKMDFLRDNNNGRGPYMLTATPLTSSPVEAFNMLSLTMPMEKFHQLGIYTPDDFIDVFGEIDTVDKLKITGDSVAKEGLVGFRNLSGLRSLFKEQAIIKNADDVGLEIPQAEEVTTDCQLSDEQAAIYEELRKEAEKGSDRPIFSVMREMERVATDMDLYSGTLTSYIPKKHHKALLAVLAGMPETKTINVIIEGEKDKQDILLDDELDEASDPMQLVIHQAFEKEFEQGLKKHGIPITDVTHPLTPKYSQLMENLRAEYDGGGKQLIFSSEKSQHRKLTRLIQHHLPMDMKKIGIINADEAAGAKTQKLAHAYNAGSIQIIIANERAEEGVDLQHGTSAIHNLTFPWTPDKLTQRKGRGVRQGNTQSRVKIYNYVAQSTLDEYRLHLIGRKEGWINKILTDNTIHQTKNGDMLDPEELAMLLASDPEAYQQKVAEAKAKRAKQETAKVRADIVRELKSLLNAEAALIEHQTENTALAKEKLQSRVDKNSSSIAAIKIQLVHSDDPALQKELARYQSQHDKLSQQLANFDEDHATKGEQLEHKIKRHRVYLLDKAEEGKLFFDPSVITNTDQVYIIDSDYVITVGTVLEVSDRIWGDNAAYKVVSIAAKHGFLNTINVEGQTKQFWLQELGRDEIKLSSLSAADFDKQQLLSKRLTYENLDSIEPSIYHQLVDQINLEDDGFLIQTSSGALQLINGRQATTKQKGQVLWPESTNQTQCKRVMEFYATFIREEPDESERFEDLESVMRTWFGRSYERKVTYYLDSATQADVNAQLAKTWQILFQEQGLATSDHQKNLDLFYGKLDELSSSLFGTVKGLGANFNEIQHWVDNFIASQENQLIMAADQQATREAEAAVRNHDDFREIPKHLADQLAEVGITARFNTTDMTTATKKVKRRTWGGEFIPAFEALFLHDRYAKNGKLYANKDSLKSRYGASFTMDSPGFEGSWWWLRSPANEDLQQITELLV